MGCQGQRRHGRGVERGQRRHGRGVDGHVSFVFAEVVLEVNEPLKGVVERPAVTLVQTRWTVLPRHFTLLLSAHTHKKPSERSELDVFHLYDLSTEY